MRLISFILGIICSLLGLASLVYSGVYYAGWVGRGILAYPKVGRLADAVYTQLLQNAFRARLVFVAEGNLVDLFYIRLDVPAWGAGLVLMLLGVIFFRLIN